MARPRVYPDEFWERAARMVHQWRDERAVSDGGTTEIAKQLGINRETLRRWVIAGEPRATPGE